MTRIAEVEMMLAGPPGTGITAAEKTEIDTRIARTDPGVTGTDGQTLRITGGQPRYRTPDAVSPLDKGGVGDGTTDDRAAILAALDIAVTDGTILDLGSRSWYSGASITLDAPVTVRGGSWGLMQGGGTPVGGGLIFPDGSDGLILEAAQYIHLDGFFVRTTVPYGTRSTTGTGTGITSKVHAPRMDRLHVHGFGLDGIYVPSNPVIPDINANFGEANQIRASYNGRDGLRLDGNDSNVWIVSGFNGTGNGGYAIFNNGMYENTFIAPHASSNVTGDYYDDAWASMWLNPYSETEGAFVIGAASTGGILLMNEYGAPVVDNIETANVRGWHVRKGQRVLTDESREAAGESWAWKQDSPASGNLSLVADTSGKRIMTAAANSVDGTIVFNASRMGFFNKTSVTQPAANPNTTGATLAELETEVNEIKNALRALGLIAS